MSSGREAIESAKENWRFYQQCKSEDMGSVGLSLYPVGELLSMMRVDQVLGLAEEQEQAKKLLDQWLPIVGRQVVESYKAADEWREEEFSAYSEDADRARISRIAVGEISHYPDMRPEWSSVPEKAREYAESVIAKWMARYLNLRDSEILTRIQQLDREREKLAATPVQPAKSNADVTFPHYNMTPEELAQWERTLASFGVTIPDFYSSPITSAWASMDSSNPLQIVRGYAQSWRRFKECLANAGGRKWMPDLMRGGMGVCEPIIVSRICESLQVYSADRKATLARTKSVKRQLTSAKKSVSDLEKCHKDSPDMPDLARTAMVETMRYWRDQTLILMQIE